jgi:cytidylate kinase/NTP pyrophosphatase (non-canonical NTP hydrolase)
MTGCQGGVPPAVVAISGPIGAGKTTVASLLAGRLGWPRAAYSDLIRSVATSRGLTHDRATLQQIGTELIATGWDIFTRQVLGQAAWTPGEPLIIDGLRHCDAATSLASAVAPLPTVVIYLEVPPGIGISRAQRRDQVPADSAQRAGSHPVESGLPAVRATADLVMPASDTRPAALASRIIEHLQTADREILRGTRAEPYQAGGTGEQMWTQVSRLNDYHRDATVEIRLLKLTEEIGEVADAYLGVHGLNRRKGVCHTRDDLLDELSDVIITAAIAMNGITGDAEHARSHFEQRLTAVTARAGL